MVVRWSIWLESGQHCRGVTITWLSGGLFGWIVYLSLVALKTIVWSYDWKLVNMFLSWP